MAPPGRRKAVKGSKMSQHRPLSLKRKRDADDLESLSRRVAELDAQAVPPPQEFGELPLSAATQDGLAASHFKTLTAIQRSAIPRALRGSDILGAAKTGSGKTLAFLVPVLENLYRKRWTAYDGLGALILSPTRELAIQIFDVLRQVGRHHTFSAGLVIGGKNLREERERLGRMNILVATPGRMLQHLDQTADLDVGNLQLLVLDEADRVMDMGFQATIDALVEHLPPDRQTLMFSATQTQKVSDLARLSLTEPEFVAVHKAAEAATPSTLQQNYVVTPLAEKLDVLWSFIRANLKKKILVFLSSGKQVRFVYEAFRHLQPGVPLLHLHGRQKQVARLDITTRFSKTQHACLFSTDVAARGLDFPAVDWVVQVDCPEDVDTYIHRVGRTARYEHNGHAILFVDPSEEAGMLKSLSKKKITLEPIHVRQKKMQHTIRTQMQNMCFKDPELKYLGQKAFISYVRSVHVQQDKETFDLKQLDLEDFAASLGLPGAPRVKFVQGEDSKARKNAPRQLLAALDADSAPSDGSDDDVNLEQRKEKEKNAIRTKYDRMFERRNQDVLADHYTKLVHDDNDETDDARGGDVDHEFDDGHDFLAVKRRFEAGDAALDQLHQPPSPHDSLAEEPSIDLHNHSSKPRDAKTVHLSTHPSAIPLTIDSKRREKLLTSRKKLLKYKGHGEHLTFDSDSDTPRNRRAYVDEEMFTRAGREGAEEEKRAFLDRERERAVQMDQVDKVVAREKRREKKQKRKERERELQDQESRRDPGDVRDEDLGVQLVPYDDDADSDAQSAHGAVRDGQDGADRERRPKRPKKWFQDTSSDSDDSSREQPSSRSKRSRRSHGKTRDSDQPQTLEDLEALASGLLASGP